ncbi:MAG: ABC transporter ATP-binding protein/permease [Actinomycetota bacterium]|nr:ABC transporter ATP-binding protein/permease [Actinomycetota bacterium]
MTNREALRALTSPADRARLWTISLASFAAGIADAACLLAISTAAVAITGGRDHIDLLGIDITVRDGLILAAAAAGVRLLLGLWSAHTGAGVAAEIVHRHRTTVLRSFIDAPWGISSAQSPGAIQQVAMANTQVAGAYVLTATALVSAGINIAVLTIAAIAASPIGAAAVAAIAVIVALVMRPWTRRSRHTGEQEAEQGQDVAARFADIVATARPITLFDVGGPVADNFEVASQQQINLYRTSRFLAGASPTVFQALVACAAAGGLWILSGRSVGNIAAFGSVALLSLRAVSQGQLAQQATQTLGAQQGFIEQLLATEAQLTAVASGFGSRDTPHIESLALQAATLQHDDRFVLGPIDLDIARHEVVGLVGHSGAGKSTVVDLLARLRQPSTGSLLVNGDDATVFSSASWAARIACVPQEPVVLAGTVADNIRWFRQLDTDRLVDAARQANIADEIDAWPRGIDTEVGHGGTQLSVGQRQRICLARALAGRPDILLLDEATSALDGASEERIRAALDSLKGSVTMVIVAHRPSTLSLCDRMVRIDDGMLQRDDTDRA